ncbi:MAG TPA: hypothetical protein VIX14_11915 [Terriglobales bacterium]
MLRRILEKVNRQLPFGYRLDVDGKPFSFVPTTTRNADGVVMEVTPLLDRRITIPAGTRSIFESGHLMADALSSQTGLHVSCCESMNGGNRWGRQIVQFEANDEPAHKVLERLLSLNSSPPREQSRPISFL